MWPRYVDLPDGDYTADSLLAIINNPACVLVSRDADKLRNALIWSQATCATLKDGVFVEAKQPASTHAPTDIQQKQTSPVEEPRTKRKYTRRQFSNG